MMHIIHRIATHKRRIAETMGDRAQVRIRDEYDGDSIYLYTHWGATGLVKDVYDALSRRQRWDDSGYLARIIFDHMKGDDVTSETGYGIDTHRHGDIWRLITVDVKNQTVTIEDNDNITFHGSMEDFVSTDIMKLVTLEHGE